MVDRTFPLEAPPFAPLVWGGMEARTLALNSCQGTLIHIATVSQQIHDSSAPYANRNTFKIVESFRRRLQTIVVSCNTILQVINHAGSSPVIDHRLHDWLDGGEPQLCLGTLSKMEEILNADSGVRRLLAMLHFTPAEDKFNEVVTLFDERKDRFRFLLNPEVWNRDRPTQQPSASQGSPVPPEGQAEHISQVQTRENDSLGNAPTENGRGEIRQTLREVGRMTATKKRNQDSEKKLVEALRWLNALDCTRKHMDTHNLRQQGTCMWLPSKDLFKRWRTGEYPFLWLHGKAGAGKSVLAASTIDYLNQTLEDGEVVVFFYCDFRNKRSTIPGEVMRSLLSQLLQHFRGLELGAKGLVHAMLEKMSQSPPSRTTIGDLCRLFSGMAQCFDRQPLIIIDGVDECGDLTVLMNALVALSKDGVRLLVIGRPLQIIKDGFSGLPSLSLEATTKDVAADIDLHITRELESDRRLRRCSAALRQEIHTKLKDEADGMFRWVQCQIDTLRRCATPLDIRNALDSLPIGLYETYERILQAIDLDGPEGKLAWRALVWLVAALRPLRLSEITEALMIDLGRRQFNRDLGPLDGHILLDALGSLVTHDEKTEIITLAHFSVKEYLVETLARTKLSAYRIKQQNAHAHVAQLCMCYLSLYLDAGILRDTIAEPGSWPVLDYIFSCGFDHIAHAHPGSPAIIRALKTLQSDIWQHASRWNALCERREEQFQWRSTPWPTSKHDFVLYILIAYASDIHLRSFLSHWRPNPYPGTNPLVYATELRKVEQLITLLSRGANMDAPGWVADDSRQALPLEVAVDHNDYTAVELFLRRGAIVPPLLLETVICMPWCSTRILARLLQTDDFAEWATQLKNENLYRGAFISGRPDSSDSGATMSHHIVIARRLNQVGCNLSPGSPLGAEFLQRAASAGHVSVLEYLLFPDALPPHQLLLQAACSNTPGTLDMIHFLVAKGVNIHTVSHSGDTGLHLALLSQWEERSLEVAKTLVEVGCDPSALNSSRESPVHIAVERGHATVVEYLLSLHVPLPRDIILIGLKASTPLRVIQLLVKHDADARAVMHNGNTAPHLALSFYSEQDCLEIIRILANAGCNLLASNSGGQTLVHAAVRAGYPSVMEYLLEQKVPLPSRILVVALDRPSSSQMIRLLVENGANMRPIPSRIHLALERYSERDCLEIVEILVGAGYDPCKCNSHGDTLFHIAVLFEYDSVMDYLVSQSIHFPTGLILTTLVGRWDPSMVQRLIDMGANVPSYTSEGVPILHFVIDSYPESTCLELLRILVDAGSNLYDLDSCGNTLIHAAVRRQFISVTAYLGSQNVLFPSDILLFVLQRRASVSFVLSLIDLGVNVHAVSPSRDSALHIAIARYTQLDCSQIVRALVGAGCYSSARNSNDMTPLHTAAMTGYSFVVEDLLLHPLNAPPPSDILLEVLQQRSSAPVIRVLIKYLRATTMIQAVTPDEDTALHFAIEHYPEHSCLEILELLVDAGCDPSLWNLESRTPIHASIRNGYENVTRYLLSIQVPLPYDILLDAIRYRASANIIRFLLNNGANVHAVTSWGSNSLELAAVCSPKRDRSIIIGILLDAGCDPRLVLVRRGSLLSDILLVALEAGCSIHVIQSLIENGANVRAVNSVGDTALHLAISIYAEWGASERVALFVQAGCNPSQHNVEGLTAIHYAVIRNHVAVIEHLLSWNLSFPSDILLVAIQYRASHTMIRLLVDNGADIHAIAHHGNTALYLTMALYYERESLEVVKILVDAGCDTSATNWYGESLIDVAARRGYDFQSVVEHLFTRDPFPPNILFTALEESWRPATIGFLIDHGADVHAVTSNGDSVLHFAVSSWSWFYWKEERLEIAKMLVNAGCDVSRRDATGDTPLDLAQRRGYGTIVDYLQRPVDAVGGESPSPSHRLSPEAWSSSSGSHSQC